MTGTTKGAVRGAVTAALTAGITLGLGTAGMDAVFAQAVSGGIMESLQGGNFGHGFVSAGVTALLMPVAGTIDNHVVRTVTGALIGGTLSEATGGKFANGAVSGAIQAAMANGGPGGRRAGAAKAGKASLPVGQSRSMTAGEIEMAGEVFGGDVDYAKVRIFNKKYWFAQGKDMAIAPDGNIYFHPNVYRDDFSLGTVSNQSFFMHEMTHVWQHQQGINVYSAVLDRTYDYTPLERSKTFQSYGLEQQADIVQDYYRLSHGSRAQWGNHKLAEYQAILPFGK